MMMALTIWQPWAGSIVYLDKRVENRDWPCPPKYIGSRIAIHAGAALDRTPALSVPCNAEAWASLFASLPEWDAWRFWRLGRKPRDEANWPPKLALGAVVGTAVITGCHREGDPECQGDPRTAGCLCSIWAGLGRWHWQLGDEVRPLAQPVLCKGRQKLWPLPEAVEAAVRKQASGEARSRRRSRRHPVSSAAPLVRQPKASGYEARDHLGQAPRSFD
jgi:hypothetical protein